VTPATADAIVVGGGVVGAAIAAEVSRGGRSVIVIEQSDPAAAVSGGSLACVGTHLADVDELALLAWSCEAWSMLAGEAGCTIEYRRCGQLRFIDDPADWEGAQRWTAAERARGLRAELLAPADVRSIEPALEGAIFGATWSPDDAVVNPFLAVRALLAIARRHGARILTRTPVLGVELSGGRVAGVRTRDGRIAAPAVILAAGPWTAKLAATADLALPIEPRKAQCLATAALPPTIRTVVGAYRPAGGVEAGYTQIQQAHSGQVLFNTVLGGGLSPGGTGMDRVPEIDRRFLRDSVTTLLRLFPSLAQAQLLRSWVRYEAVTPDDRFCIGPAGPPGLFVAAGDAGTGFVRAPGIGRLIAARLDGAPPPFRSDVYDAARFDAPRELGARA
jgi:sarcosine oxidase subunit beta